MIRGGIMQKGLTDEEVRKLLKVFSPCDVERILQKFSIADIRRVINNPDTEE